MPIYTFAPVDTDNPAWENCGHRDVLKIHADDEKSARRQASALFGNSSTSDIWMDPDEVALSGVDEDLALFVNGRVEVPDHQFTPFRSPMSEKDPTAPFVVVRDSLNSWVKREHLPNYDEYESKKREQKLRREFPDKGKIEPQQIPVETLIRKRIIEQKAELRVHTKTLLQFLDDLLTDSNMSNQFQVQPLWLESDDKNLQTLLFELRNELRRFNQAITGGGSSIEQVEKTASGLGIVGKKFLESFSTATGTATGLIFAYSLGNVLIQIGWIEPTSLNEFVSLFKK